MHLCEQYEGQPLMPAVTQESEGLPCAGAVAVEAGRDPARVRSHHDSQEGVLDRVRKRIEIAAIVARQLRALAQQS